MKYFKTLFFAVSCLIISGTPSFVNAAEEIVISYGPIELNLDVSDLEAFAETGTISNELNFYLKRLTPEGKEKVQQLLQAKPEDGGGLAMLVPGNADPDPTRLPLAISQLFHSPIGEDVLFYLGKSIQTESRYNGGQALRAAFILAASDPEGLTVLKLLHYFPSQQLRIDGKRLLSGMKAFQHLVHQTQAVVTMLEEKAKSESGKDFPADYSKLPNILAPGASGVIQSRLDLVDTSRRRRFFVDIYRPETANTQTPVIVISHGLGSQPAEFAKIAQYFASYGLTVFVPQHPGSDARYQERLLNGAESSMFDQWEFLNRPKDISFLLDELERRNQSEFGGQLNLNQVGVGGHSFGGYTALTLAGGTIDFAKLQQNCTQEYRAINVSLLLQCRALKLSQPLENLADPRVKAVYIFNPVSGLFGEDTLSQISIPVFIGGGSIDTITPLIPEQIYPFTALTTPNRYLAIAQKISHTEPLTALTLTLVPPLQTLVEPNEVELSLNMIHALALSFFKVHVANDQNYALYLQSSYPETISQSPLKFNLIHNLSATELNQVLESVD